MSLILVLGDLISKVILLVLALVICLYIKGILKSQYEEILANTLRVQSQNEYLKYSLPGVNLQNLVKSDYNIQNKYTCTVDDLRVCQIDDESSCMGCKNLLSKCRHFATDTTYVKDDGSQVIIKANTNVNEGYCLRIGHITDSCNPYHGVLVITSIKKGVQTDGSDMVLGLLCMCKNPGAIGNMDILGNCTSVFCCEGNIDNINQDLAKIKCLCRNGFATSYNSGIPYCKRLTVGDYNYNVSNTAGFKFSDNSYATLKYLLPNNHPGLNPIYQTKFTNGMYVFNPCKICAATRLPVPNGELETDLEGNYYCTVYNTNPPPYEGVPIRTSRSSSQRKLKGNSGPDGVLLLTYKALDVYGFMTDDQIKDMGLHIDVITSIETLQTMGVTSQNFKITDQLIMQTYDHDIIFPAHINFLDIAFPYMSCVLSWPNYYCAAYNGGDKTAYFKPNPADYASKYSAYYLKDGGGLYTYDEIFDRVNTLYNKLSTNAQLCFMNTNQNRMASDSHSMFPFGMDLFEDVYYFNSVYMQKVGDYTTDFKLPVQYLVNSCLTDDKWDKSRLADRMNNTGFRVRGPISDILPYDIQTTNEVLYLRANSDKDYLNWRKQVKIQG